ncbi:MAG: hypothetical protein JXA21_02230 [Anaerolineae bacterium]|nr:hypothetical protein [Anaerolineae bacterium]
MLAIFFEQPILTLVIEVVIACILAALVGLVLDKLSGMVDVAVATLMGTIMVMIIPLAFQIEWLPFRHLVLSVGQFSPDAASHLANTYLVVEVGIWTVALAAVVGYFFNGRESMVFLVVAAVVGAMACILVAAIPFYPFGFRDTAWILAIGVALIGVGWSWAFGKFVLENDKMAPPLVLWFEYVLSCWLGYQVAGRVGFLMITLPSQIILGIVLYFLSHRVLPVGPGQHADIFRSLITFNLGTQYPYYVISDWRTLKTQGQRKPDPRIKGNPFGEQLSGPGLILNSCDHVAITSTGTGFKVHPPGLSFTEQFQTLFTDVDLRPQLRNAVVEAETKDGIPVKVPISMPHRIFSDGQKIELGKPYPYKEEMILKAVFENTTIAHTWGRNAEGKVVENIHTTPWYDLVQIKGPAIMKELVSQYTCDGLLPSGSTPETLTVPRVELANAFAARMKDVMAPYGIEILGGGAGNIEPPEHVIAQRIRNWEAEWDKKIEIAVGEAEAKVAAQIQKVQQEVQVELLEDLIEILHHADEEGIQEDLLIQQLVEAIGFKTMDKSDERFRIVAESDRSADVSSRTTAIPLLDILGLRG